MKKNKQYRLLLGLVSILLIGVGMKWLSTQSNEVVFEDQALEEGIRQAIGKTEGAFMKSDLEEVEVLDLSHLGIVNLKGLEACINLKKINLFGNPIEDISPLEVLDQLQVLDLEMTAVENIEGLKNTVNLKELNLRNTKVKDIQALEKLDDLQELNLSLLAVSDLSPLMNKENLQSLNISQCEYLQDEKNLQVIGQLKNLKSFYALDCNLDNLNFLSDFNRLDHLTLSLKPSWDMSVFDDLMVETLTLSLNDKCDLTFLSNMKDVTNLNIEYDGQSDLVPLGQTHGLKALNIIGYVRMGQGNLKNLTFIKPLSDLEYLDLSNNQIQDIEPLKHLVHLKELNLSSNNIEDISPLSALKELEVLDLSHNQIETIEGLKGLQDLKTLNVAGNPVQED